MIVVAPTFSAITALAEPSRSAFSAEPMPTLTVALPVAATCGVSFKRLCALATVAVYDVVIAEKEGVSASGLNSRTEPVPLLAISPLRFAFAETALGVPAPNVQALLPLLLLARTRTRYAVSLVRPVIARPDAATQPAEAPPVCTAAPFVTAPLPDVGAEV